MANSVTAEQIVSRGGFAVAVIVPNLDPSYYLTPRQANVVCTRELSIDRRTRTQDRINAYPIFSILRPWRREESRPEIVKCTGVDDLEESGNRELLPCSLCH